MTLDDFVREDRGNGAAPVSLQDVVDRSTEIHWDEAVAIVEEFCAVALGAGDDAAVPRLSDLFIASDGGLTMQRSRGENTPTAAGRMLHTLLSNADVPMPVRLFVTQSTTQGTHRSLRQFATGLAYFGKPARAQMIQDVYARHATLARSNTDVQPVPKPEPPQRKVEEGAREQKPRSRKRVVRWAVAAALVLIVGGVATWVLRRGGSGPALQDTAARALSGAKAILADVGQQVREQFGAAQPAPAPRNETTAAPRRAVRGRAPGRAAPATVTPLVSRAVTTTKSAMWQLAVTIPTAVASAPEAAAVDTQPGPLYTNADGGVEPAMLLFPQLTPPPPSVNLPASMINRMVVDVAADGTVERVQMVDRPSRMPDMMLLSGAKTWRFSPALKDGEAVRYRTLITWTGLP
jgi:hypothetical protein